MLPKIEIGHDDICKKEFSVKRGKNLIVCENYWLPWEVCIELARSNKMNLDELLTLQLGSFLSKKGLKSDLLIYYTKNGAICLVSLLQTEYQPEQSFR